MSGAKNGWRHPKNKRDGQHGDPRGPSDMSSRNERLRGGVGEFRFRGGIRGQRAAFGHLAHLDLGAVRQTGALLGDGDGLFKGVHAQQKISADDFLGFRKRAIGDHLAALARDHAAFRLQRAARQRRNMDDQ